MNSVAHYLGFTDIWIRGIASVPDFFMLYALKFCERAMASFLLFSCLNQLRVNYLF